jgi:hypothetical protein
MNEFHERAERLVREHTPERGPLDLFDFAALAAGLGWDTESTVAFMAEKYVLLPEAARELLLDAQRERQETDLTDFADELEEQFRRGDAG